jgi:hypothetical protein
MYIVQRALDLSTLRCIFFERKFSGAYKLLLSEKGTIYGGGESFSSLHIYIYLSFLSIIVVVILKFVHSSLHGIEKATWHALVD